MEPIGVTTGIEGTAIPISIVELEVVFSNKGRTVKERLPFQVPLKEGADPEYPLLGRDPFFYKYRVDFRMGYTDDPALGKFVLYPEENKRKASKFRRPPHY